LATLLPVVRRLDALTFMEAVALLCDEDPALEAQVRRHGMPEFWSRPPGFATLTLLILEQQVSLESGAAVYRRLYDEAGGMTPEIILGLGEDRIRSCGLTRQKTGYVTALAQAVVSGELDFHELGTAPEDIARSRLLGLRGIGRWTADAYLLSALGHPDVFPVGDRALQVGVAETLGLAKVPDEEEVSMLGEPWRPLRSAAARLVWHGYLSIRGRSEPSHGARLM
jgi:DNA-3-methyladenine glycosylase II